jgi:hypothetical protein
VNNRPCQILKKLRGEGTSLVIANYADFVGMLCKIRWTSCLLTGLHDLNLLELVLHEADDRLSLLVKLDFDCV